MKKPIAVCLSLVAALSLAACSSGTNPPASATPSALQTSTPQPSEPSAQTGNALVVYFSATGNTEEVANYIAQITGADLFELEPADPYTREDLNYSDENSRVSQEHENEDLRDVQLVANTVDNWDAYDTVFIGYPIWWGIAAWPVDTFVQANDFSGKTVVPFCTSASSGIGQSGELLEAMAGTGNWVEGQRFRSSVDEQEVRTWLNELSL